MYIFGHQSNGVWSDTQVHFHEWLHIDFRPTEMRIDDFETDCLITLFSLLIFNNDERSLGNGLAKDL